VGTFLSRVLRHVFRNVERLFRIADGAVGVEWSVYAQHGFVLQRRARSCARRQAMDTQMRSWAMAPPIYNSRAFVAHSDGSAGPSPRE
jgi:hypothetical protein